jgi:DNA polymerase-3 subunit gamma/tau
MAWYRQYRPQLVSELNLKVVRETLQSMMSSGKIPQTLLFAGPKGTGKTSAARILGVLLNDPSNAALIDQLFFKKQTKAAASFVEPDPSSEFARRVYAGTSFVVQELDAASNRRIDDVRALKERLNLAPQEGKMTVYILDEVHMLTTEAFNALLKILEEPPSHVVFILATTELHKLPATIISRCSVINFYKAGDGEIQDSLERILQAEKIKYQLEDLEMIIKRADGSFRDAVKILESACANHKLDLSLIANLLSSDNQQHIKTLLDAVIAKDAFKLSETFEQMRQLNLNQRDFYQDLYQFLHQDLLSNLKIKDTPCKFELRIDQFFLQQLLSVDLEAVTPIAFLPLEIKFLEIIERSKQQKQKTSPNEPVSPSQPAPKEAKKKIDLKPESDVVEVSVEVSSTPNPSLISNPNAEQFWQKLLSECLDKHFSLSTLLKSCSLASLEADTAKIMVYYPFHKEQLQQQKNINILRELSSFLFGQEWQFDFELAAKTNEVGQESELLLAAKDVLL